MQTHDGETELVLSLAIDHPLVSRYMASAAPPLKILVTVRRLQTGGDTRIEWQGEITSMNAEGRVAKFRVPSRAGQWMLRPIPAFALSDNCVHVLYDRACLVSRTGTGPSGVAHKVTATVISVTGRDVKVDLASTLRNGNWAEDGEIVHPASGERRAILLQKDLAAGSSAVATLTMSLLIPELIVGATVEVYAGCDHTIDTCSAKFGNRQNYLGWHLKPAVDFFSPVLGGTKASG
jgi:hypothetical protein